MGDQSNINFKYTLATKEDFENFIKECDSTSEEWKPIVTDDANQVYVWEKQSNSHTINIVRVQQTFNDIPAEVLYDVLHDHKYRAIWDENMIEGKVIIQLDPYNEVGYYSAKSPVSLVSNRDFLNQRSWRATSENNEWVIINHSVEHPDYPPFPNFVRAQSILTGYLIRRKGEGSVFVYMTQSDPKGWIPSWLVNSLCTKFAPNFLKKLYQAARMYVEWKKNNDPDHKPWLNLSA